MIDTRLQRLNGHGGHGVSTAPGAAAEGVADAFAALLQSLCAGGTEAAAGPHGAAGESALAPLEEALGQRAQDEGEETNPCAIAAPGLILAGAGEPFMQFPQVAAFHAAPPAATFLGERLAASLHAAPPAATLLAEPLAATSHAAPPAATLLAERLTATSRAAPPAATLLAEPLAASLHAATPSRAQAKPAEAAANACLAEPLTATLLGEPLAASPHAATPSRAPAEPAEAAANACDAPSGALACSAPLIAPPVAWTGSAPAAAAAAAATVPPDFQAAASPPAKAAAASAAAADTAQRTIASDPADSSPSAAAAIVAHRLTVDGFENPPIETPSATERQAPALAAAVKAAAREQDTVPPPEPGAVGGAAAQRAWQPMEKAAAAGIEAPDAQETRVQPSYLPDAPPAAAPTWHGPAPSAEVARAVHQAALASHPLEPAFARDLAAEVRVMMDGGMQQADLHLNPADLGPIHIQLSLQAQTAEISFAAANGTTREGLSQSLPALREMLASQGLNLGHAGVSSGQQGPAWGEAQRQAKARQEHRTREARDGAGGASAPLGAAIALGAGRGMLDLYA